MTVAIIQFALCSAVIVVAAVWLTKFSESVATLTGLGQLFVGSLLLAGATSLPELSMNWAIVSIGLPDMAVGGLIGSSLFNLGILAIADLLHEARGRMFSRRAIESSLPGVVSIAMTAVVGIGIFVGNSIGSYEFLGVGLFSFVLLISYALGLRLVYRDQMDNSSSEPDATSSTPHPPGALGRALSGYLLCAAAIIIVAPMSANAAEVIAEGSGVGSTFFGTSIVALATSLPELVTCIAAVRMGAMNLAMGNIFGSNAFNLLLLIPLDVAFPGSLIGAVSNTHLLTCMFVMLVTSTVIIGQLYRVESRNFIVEPDAALILLLVASGLVLVYVCR